MRSAIRSIYRQADKKGYAIGAFNFSTMEILQGISRASLEAKSPAIISNSEGERSFFGLAESVSLWQLLRKQRNLILHADHTKSYKELKRVIDAGYPSAHFDGSELDYRTNLRETKRAADYAHRNDAFIEGELGGIRGGSTTHHESLKTVVTEDCLTRPDQAAEYVRITGVDSLAISVGNAHGLWQEQKQLDFQRISAIKKATGAFLVLHGGSGISAADFQKAISLGINKININTEIRLCFEKALEEGLKARKDDVPYHYLSDVSGQVSQTVVEKMRIFMSAGKSTR